MFDCVKSLIFLSVNLVVLSEVAIVNSVNASFYFGTKSLQFKKIAAAILARHYFKYLNSGINVFRNTQYCFHC